MHNERVRRAVLAALLLVLTAVPAAAAPVDGPVPPAPPAPVIAWRHSTPVGLWWAGRLRDGVELPAEGRTGSRGIRC